MLDDPQQLGRVSLWTAVAGSVVPVLIMFLVRLTFERETGIRIFGACLLLMLVAQIIALVTGYLSRQSMAGKIGLGISLFILLLFGGLTTIGMLMSS